MAKSMFKNLKIQAKQMAGIKLSWKEEATILKKKLEKLYKTKEITATTRLEIGSNHSSDEKKVKELGVKYNEEVKELNLKYKLLDQDVILAGMKREVEILENADAKQFTIPVKE